MRIKANSIRFLHCYLMACLGQLLIAGVGVNIDYDASNSMQVFGVGELKKAIKESGNRLTDNQADFHIGFSEYTKGMGPQSFRIQREGDRGIRIIHGDSVGAMYGAIEVAEQIALGGGLQAITEKARKPYILRRGLKFNIPFDARAPSYDDTGTAAHMNIPVMWEWDFWKAFIDDMVRNRYNVLSLWTTHPYPGIVKLPKYPGVNYDDVHQLKEPVKNSNGNMRHFDHMDVFDPANTVVVKTISLDDKIAFWQRVFDYAESLGIEIYFFHWNIYTFGAEGKLGITDSGKNKKTEAYMRYAIAEFLKTYPQIDGIGLSAGEHFDIPRGERETWMWNTYGEGIMDCHRENPDREILLIYRQLMASIESITEKFKDYTAGPIHTGHKYARARVHSTTTSPYFDIEYRESMEKTTVPCWLNLRNDDLFIFRWGDPDYVREFMANVPRDMMRWEAGYYMGPDGYVQGREFIQKDPDLSGQLEVDKHWYRFMLFGRLGYDLSLTRDYFEGRLAKRFPGTDAPLLYDTFQVASRIVPLVNRFWFRVNDLMFSPEGCISSSGFLTIDDSFFQYPPLKGSGILSVQQYANAVLANKPFTGITPMDVANDLDNFAADTLSGVAKLRKRPSSNRKEFLSVLDDLESMAYLGCYYADKIRGAADLAIYRQDPLQTDAHQRAVAHLSNAVGDWEAYARSATRQYKPQRFARTDVMDWYKILEEVKKEVETVREEGPGR